MSNGQEMIIALVTTTLQADDQTADSLLMRRIARGEGGALEVLISNFEARVRRLANRLMGWNGDVEDVVQEVFLAAFEKASQYRGDAALWTWLTTITLNRCRTALRRRRVRDRLKSLVHWPRRDSAGADHGVLQDEVASEVRSAVAALPQKDREVIVLFYLEHKTSSQISRLLGASENSVDVRLHRARAKLRIALDRFMKE